MKAIHHLGLFVYVFIQIVVNHRACVMVMACIDTRENKLQVWSVLHVVFGYNQWSVEDKNLFSQICQEYYTSFGLRIQLKFLRTTEEPSLWFYS